MIRNLSKFFTAVLLLNYLVYSQEVCADDHSVISQLRYDLWYNGLQISDLNAVYENPDVVEAQEQEQDQIAYPIELTIPLYEKLGSV